MSKVIVIGAGVGGMSAAIRLAKFGHSVEIFEAANEVGGKCRTKWVGDYAFDTGPSLLTLPAVYRDLFLKTGKRIEHVLKIKPVDPAFVYNFHDGTQLTFPNLSLSGICDQIEITLGKGAADQWHNLMQRAEHMWDAARSPFVESELQSLLTLVRRKGFLRDLNIIAPLKSLRKLTSEYTKDPYLKKIIDRYATYSGSDPRKVPAVLLTIAFVESSFGAWHIEGGIGQLSSALEERCRELGIQIHLGVEVTSINSKNGRVSGVSLGPVELEADFVVANADAEYVYNKLIPNSNKVVSSERKKLAKAEKSLAGFSLLLGLDNSKLIGKARKMAHHNIYFPENYDQEFDQIFKEKTPVTDPTIYICVPDDPTMVKSKQKESWFVLINAPRHEPNGGFDWSADPQSYAEFIVNKLDALGLDVSARLEVMEFQTPLDLANSVMAPGGSIYGTSSNGARSAFLRAKNRSPLKNLFLVGGSAHPGGGLPMVGIGAEIVAEAIGPAK
jgi:phytoene desaturase